MAENKTVQTKASVSGFLAKVTDKQMRADCQTLVKMMQEVTRDKGAMWGSSIVGFGKYHYRGRSGREGDWFLVGFSPRKSNLTIYLSSHPGRHPELMAKLGSHTTGVGCIYVKRLADIHLPTLKKLLRASVSTMKKMGNQLEAE